MKRLIKNLKTFKECIVKTGTINAFSGKSSNDTYHIYYGFDKQINLGVSNLREAYEVYRNNFYNIDKYVSGNSFLLH